MFSGHNKTKVVLITNGTFPQWGEKHSIPNVKANAQRLEEIFINSVGVPKENITSLTDKEAAAIIKEVQKVLLNCSGKGSTLIIYYAGHGMPIIEKGLYWATYDTELTNEKLLYPTA